MSDDWRNAATALFEGLLARTHLSRPSDVAQVVAEEAERSLGASDVVTYWVNRERDALIPINTPATRAGTTQPIDGSVAGRCFSTSTIVSVPAGDRAVRVFVPIMDGTDRVGVMHLVIPAEEGAAAPPGPSGLSGLSGELTMVLERFGHATALVLVSKMAYGDSLELVQRSRPMDLGAELLWSVVPPLTFATEGLVISAMLEPAYENGGDAFDYAVNDDLVHLAILDGVGHGLPAAGLSTFAIASYRHSRRRGLDLVDTYAAMDAAVADNFTGDRFVTAILARLDPSTGDFSWVSAGHPPPLILRDGRVVKTLASEPATPLGLPMYDSTATVVHEQLEPGDVLVLYTDGVIEARRADGTFLEVDGLAEFLEREAAARRAAPETLRRLQRTLLGAAGTVLRDDATVLLVEWNRGTESLLVPQTVQGDERPAIPGTRAGRRHHH